MRTSDTFSKGNQRNEAIEGVSLRLALYALVGAILGALVGAADSLSLNQTFIALLSQDWNAIMHGLTATGGGVPAMTASIAGAGCALLLACLSSAGPLEGPHTSRTFP